MKETNRSIFISTDLSVYGIHHFKVNLLLISLTWILENGFQISISENCGTTCQFLTLAFTQKTSCKKNRLNFSWRSNLRLLPTLKAVIYKSDLKSPSRKHIEVFSHWRMHVNCQWITKYWRYGFGKSDL